MFGKVVALSVVPESSERRSDPAGKVGAVAAHDPIPARSMFTLDIFVLGEETSVRCSQDNDVKGS